eukprot:g18631.t2
MATGAPEQKTTARATAAAPQQQPPTLSPPSENGGAPADVNGGSSPWREYLDRLAGLCGAEAPAPPTADLLRPPTDLLAHPQHHQAPGPTSTTTVDDESWTSKDGGGPGVLETSGANATATVDLDSPSESDQVLVLLDMNGTLLYRAKKPLRPAAAACGDGSEVEVEAAAAKVATAASFVHGDPDPFQYYMRPGAGELVAAMHRHPRVRLAFYTSMRGVNALPAARFLMPDDCDGSDVATTPEVYDRPFNARDPHGANSWDTTRDLPLIWSTPGRAGEGFGPSNTIMVDDTPRKMRFMDAGLVVVPEFTGAGVLEALGFGGGGEGHEEEEEGVEQAAVAAASRQREVLPRLREYLGRLLEESGADVRPFIESNPFHPRDPSSSSSCSMGVGGWSGPGTSGGGGNSKRRRRRR